MRVEVNPVRENRSGDVAGSVDIAVVVVSYNSAAFLPGLVDSLAAGLDGLRWHLVVADNASVDDSVAVVERLLPAATVVRTGRNGGYSAGINAGIAAAPEHEAVLVLNPDVRLVSGCGAVMLAALRAPGTGIVVPRLVDGDGRLIETIRREPSLLRAAADAVIGASRAGRIGRLGEVVTDPAAYDVPQVVDWAEGSTMLLSAECLRRVGPWDESFFLYSEETDFALRTRDAGLAVRYVPQARAVHLEGDSSTSPPLWAMLSVNRVRLFRRRHTVAATAVYWAALVVREGSRAALGRPTNRASVRALLSRRRLTSVPTAADLVPAGRITTGVRGDAGSGVTGAA
jgi:GT2 family glycosyltransferase